MASACIYPIILGNDQRWTLIDDHPERRILDSFGLPSATVSHSEGTSKIFDSEAGSTIPRPVEQPKSSQPPRREVRWVNLGANSQSLESIAHHFQDYIDYFLSSSSSTLRRIRALDDPSAFHTCPGYLREEITLTSEVSNSAIVSHAFADLGERCSFCGKLVGIHFGRDFGQLFVPVDETEALQSFCDQKKGDQTQSSPGSPPFPFPQHPHSQTSPFRDGAPQMGYPSPWPSPYPPQGK